MGGGVGADTGAGGVTWGITDGGGSGFGGGGRGCGDLGREGGDKLDWGGSGLGSGADCVGSGRCGRGSGIGSGKCTGCASGADATARQLTPMPLSAGVAETSPRVRRPTCSDGGVTASDCAAGEEIGGLLVGSVGRGVGTAKWQGALLEEV